MKKSIYPFTVLLGLLLVATASAQTVSPQVILTWHANNFYPADYEAKPLATPNTPISVSVAVIKNSKLLDLSQATIMWYVDENLVNPGTDPEEITFTATKSAGDAHFVRVKVITQTDSYDGSINVPVVNPQIILPVPYENQTVPAESTVSLQAIPYFFNVSALQDLSFFWKVNDQDISGNDNQLALQTGSSHGQTLQVNLLAQNQKNQLEYSRYRTQIIIQ